MQLNRTQATRNHPFSLTQRQPHPCPAEGCDGRFKRLFEARTHYQAQHQQHPHPCDIEGCQKRFKRKRDLKIHHRVHTGEKPFICPIEDCGKRFGRESTARTHRLVHTRQCRFFCPVEGCANAFKRNWQYQLHLMRHTGEKPWACSFDFCDRRFVRKEHRQMHLCVHTGDKPFACPFEGCTRRFASRAGRKSHLKIHGHPQPCPRPLNKGQQGQAGNALVHGHLASHRPEKPLDHSLPSGHSLPVPVRHSLPVPVRHSLLKSGNTPPPRTVKAPPVAQFYSGKQRAFLPRQLSDKYDISKPFRHLPDRIQTTPVSRATLPCHSTLPTQFQRPLVRSIPMGSTPMSVESEAECLDLLRPYDLWLRLARIPPPHGLAVPAPLPPQHQERFWHLLSMTINRQPSPPGRIPPQGQGGISQWLHSPADSGPIPAAGGASGADSGGHTHCSSGCQSGHQPPPPLRLVGAQKSVIPLASFYTLMTRQLLARLFNAHL